MLAAVSQHLHAASDILADADDDDMHLDAHEDDLAHRDVWLRTALHETARLVRFRDIEAAVQPSVEQDQADRSQQQPHLDAHLEQNTKDDFVANVLHGNTSLDYDELRRSTSHPHNASARKSTETHPGASVHPQDSTADAQSGIQSSLLQRLFPSLARQPNRESHPHAKDSTRSKPDAHETTSEASKAEIHTLKETVKSLESKLSDATRSNKDLRAEIQALKLKLSQIETAKHDIDQYRDQQLSIIQSKHAESLRIINRERMLFDKHKKACEILPSKRDRQEIELIRTQLADQLRVWKEKEGRYMKTQERLGKRVDELMKRNKELQEEVKVLEQERAQFVGMSNFGLPVLSQQQMAVPVQHAAMPSSLRSSIGPSASNASTRQAQRSRSTGRPTAAGPSISTVVPASTKRPDAIDNSNHAPSAHALKLLTRSTSLPSVNVPRRSQQQPAQHQRSIGASKSRPSSYMNPVHHQSDMDHLLDQDDIDDRLKLRKQNHVADTMQKSITDIIPTVAIPSQQDLDRLEKSLGLGRFTEERVKPSGKHERFYASGDKLFRLVNGTMGHVQPGGPETIYFNNGDYKTTHTNGRREYWYNETRALHVTYPTGQVTCQFENGQVETTYPDGRQEIVFVDGTVKRIGLDGMEEVVHPDGRVERRQAR